MSIFLRMCLTSLSAREKSSCRAQYTPKMKKTDTITLTVMSAIIQTMPYYILSRKPVLRCLPCGGVLRQSSLWSQYMPLLPCGFILRISGIKNGKPVNNLKRQAKNIKKSIFPFKYCLFGFRNKEIVVQNGEISAFGMWVLTYFRIYVRMTMHAVSQRV